MTPHTAEPGDKPVLALALGQAKALAALRGVLAPMYGVSSYSDMHQALGGFRAQRPMVAVVGEDLPTVNGYEFVKRLRLDPTGKGIPVLMVVATTDQATRDAVAECGAQGCVRYGCSSYQLLSAVGDLVGRQVERSWATLPSGQKRALVNTLRVFTDLADKIAAGEPTDFGAVTEACEPLVGCIANDTYGGILQGVRDHDDYSYVHSLRVATMLGLFGSRLGLDKAEQQVVAAGGLLHDVGKMLIPKEVLNKPGRLSEAEFDVMKGHVAGSISYLRLCTGLPKGVLTIAAQHHEKLDGSGYPAGLQGRELDELARMASIIDVFGALTDRRIYKAPMEAEAALGLMSEQMGAHLDMRLLRMFREVLLDTGRAI